VLAYRNKKLFVEGISVQHIAESIGTPVYIYSKKQLLLNYGAYRSAFRGTSHLICYALKANSNLSLLKLLAEQGSGADIVSGGELHRALKSGFSPKQIVFAGVGKTAEEIEFALRSQILSIHIESEQELLLIDRIATNIGSIAPISIRVNPNIDAKTHPYISTGLRKHKFGVPIAAALRLYKQAAVLKHIRIEGIHIHLGSQITGVKPFEESVRKALQFIDQLAERRISVNHLDIGGGLAVSHQDRQGPKELASVITPLLKGRKLQLILEPGRSIVATAGILLTRVLYTKINDRKHFTIVDAGMNDFIRPALYDAFHEILPVTQTNRNSIKQDVVGPVCESGDFFARNRKLPHFTQGDLLAIADAGAYGFSMSSNYNCRPRPAEVLVDDDKLFLIRSRETYEDLMRFEL
jgi:diaminopimelate decarboxylase